MLEHTPADTPLPQLLQQLDSDGYVIIPSLLPPSQVQAIKEALSPYLQRQLMGRNDFEGYDSERVYALLAKSPVFGELAAHPLVLDVCEAILGPNFMLSACLAINSHPGENAQPLHFDDSFYKVPRPRPAYGVSAFWAIDDFTDTNGATEIIPGSHKWGDAERPEGTGFYEAFVNGKHVPVVDHPGLEKVIMPAGSLMLTPGTLWHRGGANRSNASRLAITPQYCVAWGRQMESMLLSVPPHVVAQYPERIQQLLGYSIHPPFMGHVNGMHPGRVLHQFSRSEA
ncbi:MAG TPA: phytanoyl-CoA dioxygenase family protein, partial [Burkholderiaceae bacterium]|nr:phytanoyl-CoA dioxygenase family protein [Burkholderiaceae bacterium]